MQEAALKYLAMGYSVVPVKSAVKGGSYVKWQPYQKKRATKKQVEGWWKKWPKAGVGIVTGGVSKLVVLDFDVHGEHDGLEVAQSLYDFKVEGPAVRTGGGGLHAYYAHPGEHMGNAAGLAPGIDLRADGGFVYAPPSHHPSGQDYEWIEPLVPPGELPPIPAWALKLLAKPLPKIAAGDDLDAALCEGVNEGLRDDMVARLAGRYLAMGLGIQPVLMMLTEWNRKNRPPLPEAELLATVRSIEKRELMKSGQTEMATVDDEGNYSAEERQISLQALSERFHVPIDDIMRIEGEDPIYRFVSGERSIDIPAKDVGFQSSWWRAMLAMTGTVPSEIGKKTQPSWQHYLGRMLRLARHIDPGEEATSVGTLRTWIKSYLDSHKVRGVEETSTSPEEPRQDADGRVLLHLATLRRFATAEFNERLPDHKALVQQLSSHGFERRTANVSLPSGRRTTRSFWAIPEGFFD